MLKIIAAISLLGLEVCPEGKVALLNTQSRINLRKYTWRKEKPSTYVRACT